MRRLSVDAYKHTYTHTHAYMHTYTPMQVMMRRLAVDIQSLDDACEALGGYVCIHVHTHVYVYVCVCGYTKLR
jgi:hypothetical protein